MNSMGNFISRIFISKITRELACFRARDHDARFAKRNGGPGRLIWLPAFCEKYSASYYRATCGYGGWFLIGLRVISRWFCAKLFYSNTGESGVRGQRLTSGLMANLNWPTVTLSGILSPFARLLVCPWDFYTYRIINRSIKSPDNSLPSSNLARVPPTGVIRL